MHDLIRTARTTGALYLGLAVTGMLGFLVIRPQLFAAGEPGATVEAIVGDMPLARFGVLLELGIVVTQVLAALWFFKLFRSVDSFTAVALMVLGLMNAVAILGSAAALSSAVQVSAGPVGDAATQTNTLLHLSEGFWSAGVIFFGLWLLPMGYLVLKSGWAWRWLGWALIAGGVGYAASVVVGALAPEATIVVDILTVPSIVGELGIVAYLLIRGVRRTALAPDRERVAA